VDINVFFDIWAHLGLLQPATEDFVKNRTIPIKMLTFAVNSSWQLLFFFSYFIFLTYILCCVSGETHWLL